jgi:predicted alpha/beta hydrolase family esterase
MTLATRLRLVLVAAIGAGAALAAWLLPPGAPSWLALLLGLALPFAFTAALLAAQVAVGAIVDPRRPRMSPCHVLAVWWKETRTSLRYFLWRVPFAARCNALPLAHDPQRPAVLLVHGYFCNSAVWQPLLDSGVLRDCSIATVELLPTFAPIDRYVDLVHDGIDRLLAVSGAPRAILVCHSMGGLVARAYLQRRGDARVARVITLATPHQGTVFGRLGLGANARQMATGSRFLAGLAAAESASLRAKFVCIATADDNLIVPRSSPLLPGATARVIEGVGHLALIEDPRAWRIVAEEIGSVRPG